MENTITLLFQLAILIFSIVLHEVSHGVVANALGDPTAKLQGRLTLNPIAHVSFFGMLVLPVLSYFAWGVPIGAAKPVPYNPAYLRNQRWGSALVAAAGPGANLLLAVFFSGVIRIISLFIGEVSPAFLAVMYNIIFLNIWLAVFNLIPIPPIDGSKIIYPFLPRVLAQKLAGWSYQLRPFFAQYGIIILIFVVVFGGRLLDLILGVLYPIAIFLYTLLLGVPPGNL